MKYKVARLLRRLEGETKIRNLNFENSKFVIAVLIFHRREWNEIVDASLINFRLVLKFFILFENHSIREFMG